MGFLNPDRLLSKTESGQSLTGRPRLHLPLDEPSWCSSFWAWLKLKQLYDSKAWYAAVSKMDTRNIISCHHHHQCELMNVVSGSMVVTIHPPFVLTLGWMSSPLYLPKVVLIKAFESKHCSLADVHTSSPFQNQSSLTLYGMTPVLAHLSEGDSR